jgi:hypothetical protein
MICGEVFLRIGLNIRALALTMKGKVPRQDYSDDYTTGSKGFGVGGSHPFVTVEF